MTSNEKQIAMPDAKKMELLMKARELEEAAEKAAKENEKK